jgi:hypothetical protein
VAPRALAVGRFGQARPPQPRRPPVAGLCETLPRRNEATRSAAAPAPPRRPLTEDQPLGRLLLCRRRALPSIDLRELLSEHGAVLACPRATAWPNGRDERTSRALITARNISRSTRASRRRSADSNPIRATPSEDRARDRRAPARGHGCLPACSLRFGRKGGSPCRRFLRRLVALLDRPLPTVISSRLHEVCGFL